MSGVPATKDDLRAWVPQAVRENGGQASVLEVAEDLWAAHEVDLRTSGALFFTWQYDMRWCATALRHDGVFAPAAPGVAGKRRLA